MSDHPPDILVAKEAETMLLYYFIIICICKSGYKDPCTAM